MTQDDRLPRLLDEWNEKVAGGPSLDAAVESAIETVWGASEFVSTVCLRHPSLFYGLVDLGILERALSPGELSGLLADRLTDVSDDG